MKKYSNVTILFADIVNFTPLTAILPSADLVAVLNELFGQFDEAAKVLFQKIKLGNSVLTHGLIGYQLFEDQNSWRLLQLRFWNARSRRKSR